MGRSISSGSKSGADSEWEQHFDALRVFKRQHGYLNVPKHWPEFPGLARWLTVQRLRQGRLSVDQLKRLFDLGFDFGGFEMRWLARLFDLVAYKRKHGHFHVPFRWRRDPSLSRWARRQRDDRSSGRLSLERIQRLNEIGFDWIARPVGLQRKWERRFHQLETFKQGHGHCNVPDRWPKNPQLGGWVRQQRTSSDAMLVERRRLLDELGFEWEPFHIRRERKFEELQAFQKRFGHYDVPSRWVPNPSLACWVNRQRTLWKAGEIPNDLKQRLDALGFHWEVRPAIWERRYNELKSFRKEHGHCLVPYPWSENPKLSQWVVEQRVRFRKRFIPQDQKKRLDDQGFDWNPWDSFWQRNFERLKAFRSKHGHCLVPLKWAENPELGSWVNRQRARKEKMSRKQRELLNGLGFEWRPLRSGWDQVWNERFQQLRAFQASHGHCRVPWRWARKSALSRWVAWHRGLRKRIPRKRKRLLDSLGFDWQPRRSAEERSWKKKFRELAAFKKQHGHCDVGRRWKAHSRLRMWLWKQRRSKDILPTERRKRLEVLGLDWHPLRSRWERRFQELKAFRKQYGHSNVVRAGSRPLLANWVRWHRDNRTRVSPERKRRLNEIGFQWRLARSRS